MVRRSAIAHTGVEPVVADRYNPCAMSISNVLDVMQRDPAFMANVPAWERMRAREARYGDFPEDLDPRLVSALRARGTAPLFTHQVAAVEAALAGENMVVVTGTASGKRCSDRENRRNDQGCRSGTTSGRSSSAA